MNIQILESANTDLIEGYHFYEMQEKGAGDYFLNSIYTDIEFLLLNFGKHPVMFESFYCMYARNFPFTIYYRTDDKTIFLEAILDCRQNPDKALNRLE